LRSVAAIECCDAVAAVELSLKLIFVISLLTELQLQLELELLHISYSTEAAIATAGFTESGAMLLIHLHLESLVVYWRSQNGYGSNPFIWGCH